MEMVSRAEVVDAGSTSMMSPDRFDDMPQLSVFRPVAMTIGDCQGLCLIRTISANGFVGHVHARLPTGQVISIQAGFDRLLTGTIIWANELEIGVAFESPIDVAQTLQLMAARLYRGKVQRMPRISIPCEGTVHHREETHRTSVVDISQGGAKIEAGFLNAGDEVMLAVEGLDTRRAKVTWTQRHHVGLTFFRPFKFSELAAWAIAVHGHRYSRMA